MGSASVESIRRCTFGDSILGHPDIKEAPRGGMTAAGGKRISEAMKKTLG